MNRQDFQRNFSQSYYGLIYNDALRSELAGAVDLHLYELSNGTLIPAYRPSVDGSRQLVSLLLKKRGSDEIYVHKAYLPWKENIDEDKTFMRPGVPSVGMIQGIHTATYVSRVPVRDTPRGHAHRFCKFYTVNANALNGLSNGTDTFLVWRVFNKIYYSWEGGITALCNGECIGVALDKFIALGTVPNRRHIQIFYKDQGAVGRIDDTIPYIYSDKITPSIKEYVKKLSGHEPIER